jgi:hypothetical protein
MNTELTKKLLKEFPIIYRGHKQPITQNLMSFGFEYSNGWYELTYNLSARLEKMAEELKAKGDLLCVNCCELENQHPTKEKESKFGTVPSCSNYEPALPIAVQMKEKYGTLRAYFHNTTDEMEDIIQEAELLSETTCEQCGRQGVIRGNGWLYTACDDHSKEEDK